GYHFFMEETVFPVMTNCLGYGDNLSYYGQCIFHTCIGAIQTRASAWDIKQLALAATVAPDGSDLQKLLFRIVENNIQFFHQRYVATPNHPFGV
ncbi:hypothetical protein ACUOIV_28475, partial [Escherichia coli]